jgi:superfamily II RNA helicase
MAGRAGRRGIDTIGHVIHCNNLYDIPYDHDYSNILNGKPLPLVSKYETSMNTILTMINSKVATIENISELSSASLSSIDNEYQKQITLKNIASINETIDNEKKSTKYQKLQNNSTILDEYLVMEKSLGSLRPNQFKKTKQKMEKLLQNEPDLKELVVYKQAIQMHNDNLQIQQKELQHLDEYFVNSIKHKIDFLQENNYIQDNNVSDEGNVARLLQEVPGLLFGKLLIKTNFLETLSPQHIIVLFSTINNIRVKEENRRLNHYHIKDENTKDLCNVLDILVDLNDTLLGSATSYSLIPYEEELNYDVIEFMLMWINIDDETSCRIMLEKMKQESEIFLGEFIKTVIKINNITEEMKKVAEYFQRIDYLNKLTLISSLLLKFVATNQSLYV